MNVVAVEVTVIVEPLSVIVVPVPPDIVMLVEPLVLLAIWLSLAPPAETVREPSLETEPSTSVAEIVTVPAVCEIAAMPEA